MPAACCIVYYEVAAIVSKLVLALSACLFAHSADVDGCVANGACSPGGGSLANGTCIDAKAPSTGFSCGCITGATWSGNACDGERHKIVLLLQVCVVPSCCSSTRMYVYLYITLYMMLSAKMLHIHNMLYHDVLSKHRP
jgi:hypothetical protein